MTKNPIVMQSDKLAVEALKVLKENNISCMPILSGNEIVGTIRLQDIIHNGILG